jgi:hypothetical protein
LIVWHDWFSLCDDDEFGCEYRDKHLTPKIPDNCPPLLRELMQLCWKENPDERPVSSWMTPTPFTEKNQETIDFYSTVSSLIFHSLSLCKRFATIWIDNENASQYQDIEIFQSFLSFIILPYSLKKTQLVSVDGNSIFQYCHSFVIVWVYLTFSD